MRPGRDFLGQMIVGGSILVIILVVITYIILPWLE